MRVPFEDLLVGAFLEIQSADDCEAFLADLLTPQEIEALAQRIGVAKALLDGATYEQAGERTGASSATISRVRRAIFHGSGGYRRVLERRSQTE